MPTNEVPPHPVGAARLGAHAPNLTGKVALITGGTSGIGRATALAIASAGARTVIIGRRAESAAITLDLIKAAGGEAMFVRADVCQARQVEMAVEQTLAVYGGLDIAFNNAGVDVELLPLAEASEDEFDRVFDTNVRGLWLSLKYEIRAMLKLGRGGSIINNSSVLGSRGTYLRAHYVAAKHAVEGYTKAAALEVAAQGIRVNAVAPDYVRSEANALDTPRPTSEVVTAVLFLAGDEASFITGTSLPVESKTAPDPT